MEADGIFVYGTLRAGGANRCWLERTNPLGTCLAWVPGKLFHLPEAGFPALVADHEPTVPPPSAGWVTGEFVGYEDDDDLQSALADLDPLEGTEKGLFERIILPVYINTDNRYWAWVYVFSPDRLPRLEREGMQLPDGDWAPYLMS